MIEAGGLPAGVDFSGGGLSQVPSQAPLTQWNTLLLAQTCQLWESSCEPPARTSSPWGQGEPSAQGGRVQGCVGEGWVLFFPFLGESGSLSEFTTCRAIMLKSNGL